MYVDSRASNHLSFGDSSFCDKFSYGAPEQVFIGDGLGLSFKSAGSSFFTTSCSDQSFLLKEVLHLPSISKILSVSRSLLETIKLTLSFFPDHFVVKQ